MEMLFDYLFTKIESGVTVVMPSTESARSLLADYVRNNRNGRHVVASSAVISMQEFLSRIFREYREKDPATDISRMLFASHYVKEHRDALSYFIPSDADETYLLRVIPFIASMLSSLPDAVRCVKGEEVRKNIEDLYEAYGKDLEITSRFEPDWLISDRIPDFEGNYLIAFPDADPRTRELTEKLKERSGIEVMPLTHKPTTLHIYSNEKQEIRDTFLRISKAMQNDEKLTLDTIALTVSGYERLRPYIEREGRLFNIPLSFSRGIPFSATAPGRLLSYIEKLHDSSFHIDTMKPFLLDNGFPWKDKHLVREYLMLCIMMNVRTKERYITDADKLFNERRLERYQARLSKLEDKSEAEPFREMNYGNDIITSMNAIYHASSFKSLEASLYKLTDLLFNADMNWNSEIDNAAWNHLRKELRSLAGNADQESIDDINLFTMMLRVIESKSISSKNNGIAVYPMGDGIGVHYKMHYIIGLSEEEGRVQRKHASFLENHEVDEEHRTITDITGNMLQHYMASNDATRFSSSQMTYEGSVIPLCEFDKTIEITSSDLLEDPYQKEREYTTLSDSRDKALYPLISKGHDKAISQVMRLHGDEESVTGSLKVPLREKDHYSYSNLKTYSQCPFCYLLSNNFHMDKIQEYEGTDEDPVTVGNRLHRVMELYLRKHGNEVDIPDLEKILDKQLDLWEERKEDSKNNENAELKDMDIHTPFLTKEKRSFIKNHYMNGLEMAARYIQEEIKPDGIFTELSLSDTYLRMEDNDGNEKTIRFSGFIDLLLRVGDNFRIYDYKTNSPEKESMQMAIYEALLPSLDDKIRFELTDRPNEMLVESSAFITLKDGKVYEYTHSTDEIDEYIANTVFRIEEGDWHIPDKPDCRYCKFKTICHKGYNVR